ncbi:MAG: hypothetical protein HQL49_02385 [Gammaproteobacteria bacterium]|nr:hypothetical protein [Gammaproteobacteria bacterium]
MISTATTVSNLSQYFAKYGGSSLESRLAAINQSVRLNQDSSQSNSAAKTTPLQQTFNVINNSIWQTSVTRTALSESIKPSSQQQINDSLSQMATLLENTRGGTAQIQSVADSSKTPPLSRESVSLLNDIIKENRLNAFDAATFKEAVSSLNINIDSLAGNLRTPYQGDAFDRLNQIASLTDGINLNLDKVEGYISTIHSVLNPDSGGKPTTEISEIPSSDNELNDLQQVVKLGERINRVSNDLAKTLELVVNNNQLNSPEESPNSNLLSQQPLISANLGAIESLIGVINNDFSQIGGHSQAIRDNLTSFNEGTNPAEQKKLDSLAEFIRTFRGSSYYRNKAKNEQAALQFEIAIKQELVNQNQQGAQKSLDLIDSTVSEASGNISRIGGLSQSVRGIIERAAATEADNQPSRTVRFTSQYATQLLHGIDQFLDRAKKTAANSGQTPEVVDALGQYLDKLITAPTGEQIYNSNAASPNAAEREINQILASRSIAKNLQEVQAGMPEEATTEGETEKKLTEKDRLDPTPELSAEEQRVVQQLQQRDREVRTHEQAHISAAGDLPVTPATYEYDEGPDGKRYAVGGEVGITIPNPEEPREKIDVGIQVQRVALAPAEPSTQDRKVAAQGSKMEQEGRSELAQQMMSPENKKEGSSYLMNAMGSLISSYA